MAHRNLEQELIAEFGTATFSTRNPLNKALGWSGGHVDEHDFNLRERVTVDRRGGIQHWANPIQLDQGREGACVGFGHTGVINAAPEIHEFGNQFGFDLYHLAQTLDPWEGEAYEGTSVRAGAKAATQTGYYSGYAFTQDISVAALYVLNHGPLAIGVDWHTGMDRVDSEGFIHNTGEIRGGHCVVVDGVVWSKPDELDRFRIRNSWGPEWGFNGRCRISADDLQQLFLTGGTACAPIEVAA